MKGAEPIFINNHGDVGILMLHGFTSTPDEFRELSVYLSEQGFNLYAPLIAGHGTSPEDLMKTRPEDWMLSAKQAYVRIKATSQKVFIIGNSFGSNLGFWLIKEFKNEPAGIITLDAPIILRNHFFAILRLYTYGLFKKYYVKSKKVYETDYIDGADDITYRLIPLKSLREFLKFIKYESIPHLSEVKIPILIAHSKDDPIIHPKSAPYIHSHIGSSSKKIYWVESRYHGFTIEGRRKEVFHMISKFIQEILSYE